MSLAKFEVWVHDRILRNVTIRHFVYAVYQRVVWLFSRKLKSEGKIERITPKDGFEYLFGYYDKCPWSPDKKRIVAIKTLNAHKEPDSCSRADVVIIDVGTKAVKTVATISCWNVQQGCMLQWLSNEVLLFNDFRENKYVCVIKNVKTDEERVIDRPVYDVSRDKKIALSLDFSRLHRLRPGYGYCNIEEETRLDMCPDSPCIWKINLETGEFSPLLKYTDFASFEPKETMAEAEHKVNHLMISPDGKRFIVLHRWILGSEKYTRLVSCDIDGKNMYNLSDDDFVSHCFWKNNFQIISYLNKKVEGKGYFLLNDKSHNYKKMWPELVFDGHPSYSDANGLYVTDTYPDRRRVQSIYVMNENKVCRVARVFAPFKYKGDVRCDLHPRWSRDGTKVCFDGSFEGKRGVYVADVADAIKSL